jgi:hypothetical protein
MRQNDTACIFNLIVEEFTEIAHIHLAFVHVGNCGKAVEKNSLACHVLYRANDVRELSNARGLNEDTLGSVSLNHLSERLAEIAHKGAADAAGVHFGNLNARVLHKSAVDAYGADDGRSMADNNSSAFNFRRMVGSSKLSKHSLGRAVDINPRYNPYVKKVGDQLRVEPPEATPYVDRSKKFPYKITADDLCCHLFKAYGFTWGGDWHSLKDYQHFER